jgi:arginase
MDEEKPTPAVAIIGAGLDLGQGRRGVDMGPSAIRYAGLQERIASLGRECVDWGDVEAGLPEATEIGDPQARYLGAILRSCGAVATRVADARSSGYLPLVLGGDHSVAMGTLGGMAKVHGAGGVLWLDAHADMNRPGTTPSGNVHGMPLAAIAGHGPRELTHIFDVSPKVDPRRIVIVGLRDVDQMEKPHVRSSGVRAFTMRDIDERGLRTVMEEAIRIASAGAAGFHVSLDMDFIDPKDAPGVGTPVRGGATYREAHLAMEMICDSRRMLSLEVVEVNPVIDEVNRTAELAVELAASALGKRIL